MLMCHMLASLVQSISNQLCLENLINVNINFTCICKDIYILYLSLYTNKQILVIDIYIAILVSFIICMIRNFIKYGLLKCFILFKMRRVHSLFYILDYRIIKYS